MQDKKEDTEGIIGDPTDEATDTAEINERGTIKGCGHCDGKACHKEWADD